jgi:hypothetical protein
VKGMFTRWPAIVAATLAVMVAGAGASFAALRGADDDGILQPKALTFAVQNAEFADVDAPPRGRSAGDTFFADSELWNVAQTKQRGTFHTVCVLAQPRTSLNHCSGTAFLHDGKVVVEGANFFTETAENLSFAVVGGTGRFANVVGQARLRFGEPDVLTVRLAPSFRRP